MITFCKNYLKNLVCGIEIDGVSVNPQYLYLKKEDTARPKVAVFGSIISLKDVLESERAKLGKRFITENGTTKLQFKKSKYFRRLTLVLTIAAHTEEWIDKLFTEILKQIDRRVQNGDDWIEIEVKEISWQDDSSILDRHDLAVMIVEFRQNIAVWEDVPYFSDVSIEPNLEQEG